MKRLAVLASPLLFAAACTVGATGPGPGDDDPGGDDDPAGAPDAGEDPAATCAVEAQLAGPMLAVTAERRNQQGSQGARQYYRLLADFNGDAQPDKLQLDLWDERGAFVGDVVPGTYSLAGAEVSVETCGVCAFVLGDFAPPAEQFFFATGGTITIDTVEPTLAGSLANVTLAQIDGATGAPVTDGCATTITAAEFSATVTIVDSGGGGGN